MGLRSARVWKTNASISMPVPAITQAISAPAIPVCWANLDGSEKTPAPTMLPTTIMVIVAKVSFCAVEVVSVLSATAAPSFCQQAVRLASLRCHSGIGRTRCPFEHKSREPVQHAKQRLKLLHTACTAELKRQDGPRERTR